MTSEAPRAPIPEGKAPLRIALTGDGGDPFFVTDLKNKIFEVAA